jgi:hypothetical protein
MKLDNGTYTFTPRFTSFSTHPNTEKCLVMLNLLLMMSIHMNMCVFMHIPVDKFTKYSTYTYKMFLQAYVPVQPRFFLSLSQAMTCAA